MADQDRFGQCLAHVLRYEGGFANHPKDPGGATMRGVTQAVYDGYRERKGLARQTVRDITEDELRDIYRAQYWWVVKADSLPVGLDFATFDFAVNSGPTRAVRYLQTCLGVPADGHMGAVTLDAARRADVPTIIAKYITARLKFLRGLRTYPTFGKGWERRCKDVLATALAHVADGAAPLPAETTEPPAKAVSEAKPVSNKIVGPAVAIGTGAATTVAQQTIAPPPQHLQDSVTNVGLWQTLGRKCGEFGQFVVDHPLQIGLIVTCVVAIWLAPRLLPLIWGRK